jgi:Flp pilus assembly protein CpaB
MRWPTRFSLRRKLPTSSIVTFVLAGTAGVSAFLLVQGATSHAQLNLGESSGTVVVVLAHDVAPGTALTDSDISLAEMIEPPPTAFTDPSRAIGLVTVTPFVAGEAVTSTRMASGGGRLTVSVPPGLVGITLTVETAPEGLAAGDHVDILATYTTARPYTTMVAEGLRVLAVANGGATVDGRSESVRLTFATTPEIARSLVGADATAVLAAAVRGYEPVTTEPPAT